MRNMNIDKMHHFLLLFLNSFTIKIHKKTVKQTARDVAINYVEIVKRARTLT